MRHLTPDMATIIVATSNAGRKGLKPSSVATNHVRDEVEDVISVKFLLYHHWDCAFNQK